MRVREGKDKDKDNVSMADLEKKKGFNAASDRVTPQCRFCVAVHNIAPLVAVPLHEHSDDLRHMP